MREIATGKIYPSCVLHKTRVSVQTKGREVYDLTAGINRK